MDRAGSISLNLTYASTTAAILRVDSRELNTTTGRMSVRVESKKQFDQGLFVFNIHHAPVGFATCPALWMADHSSPSIVGEIDIAEAGNAAVARNQMTLHTSDACTMRRIRREQSGRTITNDCFRETNDSSGCTVLGPHASYGRPFNENGGGVYALEVRSDGIRIWFWTRTELPEDVRVTLAHGHTTPDPSQWGRATADFPNTRCTTWKHFRNMSIIANIDLCGQQIGTPEVFGVQGSGNCTSCVPNASGRLFRDAFWEFGGWWVFQAV